VRHVVNLLRISANPIAALPPTMAAGMLVLLTASGYVQLLLVRPGTDMVAKVRSVAFHGVEVIDVETQVTIASGLPAFTIVGLPDKTVAESRERVRAALASLGLGLPPRRITVNLAPADVLKEGSHFDLPVALGLLAAMEVLPADEVGSYTALGELALDGSLTGVAGVLLAALAAVSRGSGGVICPAACGGEAAWAGEVEIVAAPSLLAIVNHFKGTQLLPPPEPRLVPSRSAGLDLLDVKGQESAKRALEIAAAGGHNLLMVGPPGSGKSMLAARLPGILPPLEPAEALELGMIQSVAGGLRGGGLTRERPFRDPHHSASLAALVGGGPRARPGEISLAHKGVLFLDELPEFNRPALEALRQPLETGRVSIARAQGHVTYPARFQLIAAMNPCRCGHFAELACGRAPRCAEDYQGRLSGPLLDRIDLHIDVPAVAPADLALPTAAEGSAEVASRVATARARQAARYAGLAVERRIRTNAEADGALLDEVATPEPAGRALLTRAAERLRLSARAYHRVLRVARTLADLDGASAIGRRHVAEALSYRRAATRVEV
jgi:magnesium chelatase family protein